MSTMPPEQQPPPHQPAAGTAASAAPGQGAILPIPGNAEFAVWLLVEIVLAIVWASSDGLDAGRLLDGDDLAHVALHRPPRHREGEPRARAITTHAGWEPQPRPAPFSSKRDAASKRSFACSSGIARRILARQAARQSSFSGRRVAATRPSCERYASDVAPM